MSTLLAASSTDEIAAIVFLDIAVIIVVARLAGMVFRRLRQPAVIGEIIGGILLGPTLLGALPGNPMAALFPDEVQPFLRVIAQLGLIIFMFIVGLELDLKLIRGKERAAAVVSVASIVLPFGLGLLLAGALYAAHGVVDGQTVERLPFALFIGASMSVTAFPVLARILSERGMNRTPIGALALACAAVDDVLAWSLLAVVLAVVSSSGLGEIPLVILESVAFAAFMLLVVRPQLGRLAARYQRAGRLTPDVLAIVLIGLLVSSWLTSQIGIHSIFGAFVWGTIMPRAERQDFSHAVLERLEPITVLLLLPVFFIATGLGVNIRGIDATGLGELALILLVACAGKFLGASAAAKAQGFDTRQSLSVGILMNTRGLTELVILNVGRDFGVLDDRLFTLLVVMAVTTTVITEPLLRVVYPDRLVARDIAEAERAALQRFNAYRVAVLIEQPAAAAAIVEIALDIIGDEQPAELVLTRLEQPSPGLDLGSGRVRELAGMADQMRALNVLSRRAHARGVSAVVLSRFSGDVAADLLAQVAGIDADLLVVAAADDGPSGVGAALVQRLFDDAPCDVAVLVDPAGSGLSASPDRPVVAVAGEGPHDAAAIEIAVRLARTRRVPVQLLEGDGRRGSRRGAVVARQIAALGVPVEPVRTAGETPAQVAARSLGAGGVLVGLDDEGGGGFGAVTDRIVAAARGPVLVVRSPRAVSRNRLEDLRERIERRDPPAPREQTATPQVAAGIGQVPAAAEQGQELAES